MKQEERFTEVGNPDYDAFTKIEGSKKKHMEQFGENLMKNLLNELQDSKREMEEKLNHVMVQTKSYAESVQTTSLAIMGETKYVELVEEKQKKFCSKNFIINGVEEYLLVTTRVMLLNLTIST